MDLTQASAQSYNSAVRLDRALSISALCVLYYDYILTITSEIQFVWSSPSISPSFVLFVANRYVGILGHIPVFFEYLSDSSEHTCRELQLYHQVYVLFSQGIVAVLMALRTYALYNCSKRMLGALLVMLLGGVLQCLASVSTGKSPLTSTTASGLDHPGCDLSLTDDQGFHLGLAWSAVLWYDTAIFLLTFYKAIKVRKEMQGGLLVTIIRDGTLYYAIMVVANMVNVISFMRSPSALKGTPTTLTNMLSVTLTSRLMLNIRIPSSTQLGRRTNQTTHPGGWTTGWESTARSMSFHLPRSSTDALEMEESTGTDSSG